jgi:hypothetical protein
LQTSVNAERSQAYYSKILDTDGSGPLEVLPD